MGDPLILGIHYGHDSGAAIIKGPRILAAVSEERFTRIKHYGYIPFESIKYCLRSANADINDIDAFAFPRINFPSHLQPFLNFNEKSLIKISKNKSVALNDKIKRKESGLKEQIGSELIKIIGKIGKFFRSTKFKEKSISSTPINTPPSYFQTYIINHRIPIYLVPHHLAHAASAYYTSGFGSDNLIITADGIGDRVSTAVWQAIDGEITPLIKYGREGSLGWFYGIVTEALGWWIGNGEGKTMGLAAYGNPSPAKNELTHFLPIYKNGYLQKEYQFSEPSRWRYKDTFHWHFKEANSIQNLLKKYKREEIAASCQALLEESMLDLISYWVKKLDIRNVCSSGGVFLNVKMNQHLLNNLDIDNYHIFPDAGDAGLALGAALQAYSKIDNNAKFNAIKDVYSGPNYSNDEIETILEIRKLKYSKTNEVAEICSEQLAKGKIIGWFQGRMEQGPRALGNRSILIDPRLEENKDIINNNVKFRDPWRPFCPSILEEQASEYFLNSRVAPYMIISFDVIPEKINEIPAVVHVDGTARPQTVSKDTNPIYYQLIKCFGEHTSVPILLNTSFNIKGDPIICSPIDAIECFFSTGIDILALNNFIIEK